MGKTLDGYWGWLSGEADRILAVLGMACFAFLGAYVVIAFGRVVQLTAPVLGFLCCLAYLLIRRRLTPSPLSPAAESGAGDRQFKAVSAIFFLLLAASILSVYFSPEPYARPVSYFVTTALMAAAAAVGILVLPSRRWCVYLALFQILLISLSVMYSQEMLFPTLFGMDPWGHRAMTQDWLGMGHITEAGQYSRMPVLQMLVGGTMLLTNLDYKPAAMLSVTLPGALINTLFVFLLGRFLFNQKVGLLAALLLGVASYAVRFGIWAIPNTLGAMFVMPIVYLLFKFRGARPVAAAALYLVLMAVIIVTHPISTVWLAVTLFTLWAGAEMYPRLHRQPITVPVAPGTAVLFAVAMLGYWLYVSNSIFTLFTLTEGGFERSAALYSEYGRYLVDTPTAEQLFNTIGGVLFFALSVIGFLSATSRKVSNSRIFAVFFVGVVTVAIAYLPPITGRSVIEDRWGYQGMIIAAIPVGVGLSLVVSALRQGAARAVLLATVVAILAFFMTAGPGANMDASFSPNSKVRLAFTESELRAVSTTAAIRGQGVATDSYYMRALPASMPGAGVSDQFDRQDFADCRDWLVLIREEISTHPFIMGYIGRLTYDPREVLVGQGFSRVYDVGSVTGFAWGG